MPKTAPEKRPLSADDWVKAALLALERGGAAAVSVEALARSLGSTKGSFYWHFASREALLSAALLRWEEQYTSRVIASLEAIPSPRERLARLIHSSNASETSWRIHVALGASTEDPIIAQVLERVSRRRIAYLEGCCREMGATKVEARQRALLAYSAYLGFLRLRVECPEELPPARGREAFFDSVVAALLPSTRRSE